MQAFIICELIAIFFLTCFLMHRYAAKYVPLGVKIFILIPWLVCFLSLGLTPIDAYYSYTTNGEQLDTGPTSAPEVLQGTWRGIYWTSFFMGWFGLPLVRGYVEAGDFTAKDRIKRSVKGSLKSYLTMIVLGVAFVLYLLAAHKIGTQGLMQFLVTFSSCFGVVLIIIFLGFGLVHMPKRCIQKTNKEMNLKYYQYKVAEVADDRIRLETKLSQLIQNVYALSISKDTTSEQKEYLAIVLTRCNEEFVEKAKRYTGTMNQRRLTELVKDQGEITHEKIVELHRTVKQSVKELERLEYKYQNSLQSALFAEDVIDSKTAEDWNIKFGPETPPKHPRLAKYWNWTKWAWFTKVQQIFYLVVGVFFGLVSVFIFVMEILTFLDLDLLNLGEAIGNSFATSQVVCLIPLLYMTLCVYSSLFNMKLSAQYGLYAHHTDAGSLVFASVNFSRVTTPLIFNFLQMNQLSGTNYNVVMGNASIAYSFGKYFPVFLIVFVLAQVFDVYGRIMNSIGLSTFRFSADYNDSRIEEGRSIIARTRKSKATGIKERGISRFANPSTTSTSTSIETKPSLSQTLNSKLLGKSSTERLDSESGGDSGRSSRMMTLTEGPDTLKRKITSKLIGFELGKIFGK